MYRVLSLFAGIGGFDLGLERTGGFRTVAFCEIDPFCQRVLARHWPDVPCYEDVRELTAERLASDGIEVDCIVGGFPCQDISYAGRGAGIGGERSGLWSEYARLVGELRPSNVIVENVPALLTRGLSEVLGTLAAIGYDAEWHCIPAAYVGAPHRRDRIWIVAHPSGLCSEPRRGVGNLVGAAGASEADCQERQRHGNAAFDRRADVADANQPGLEGRFSEVLPERAGEWPAGQGGSPIPDAESLRRRQRHQDSRGRGEGSGARQGAGPAGGGWWSAEPDVGRVAHGVPARVDRLRALGNAVVPQIPEMIGRAILATHPPTPEIREAAR